MAIAVVKRHLSVSKLVIQSSRILECEWGDEEDVTAQKMG